MNELFNWLKDSDLSIQYRLEKDLLKSPQTVLTDIQTKMLEGGWGYELLTYQKEDGYWEGYYSPKWISTHYTLQTLRCLNYPKTLSIKYAINRILKEEKCKDGGISPSRLHNESDCCVNGMFLTIACYYHANINDLKSMIDYLILAQINDGGFNCSFNRHKVHHSAFNSTLCVIEGLWEYENQGYDYRIDDVKKLRKEAEEFLLHHQLYISDKTNQIIDERYCSTHFPYYWRYDLLRVLEYFVDSNHTYDKRLENALIWLESKHKEYRWNVNAHYSGLTYFTMEKAGKQSKMITIRALKVLHYFNRINIKSIIKK
ncbi:MAG TPA: hypothetical protein VFH18_06685 [Erysipelotrichaceae bacterium]|nr:hypothetical protein [Erysipelotrichaceae bacterium]